MISFGEDEENNTRSKGSQLFKQSYWCFCCSVEFRIAVVAQQQQGFPHTTMRLQECMMLHSVCMLWTADRKLACASPYSRPAGSCTSIYRKKTCRPCCPHNTTQPPHSAGTGC